MKRFITIGLGILIFILIIVGVTFLESLKKPPSSITTFPTPTSVVSQRRIQDPIVNYDKEASDRLLDIARTRPTPIDEQDKVIRSRLLASVGNESGTIANTPSFRLEYVKAPNSFEVEIKTTEITNAKIAALEYLRLQGLSEDGICKLPLMFYLNFDVSKTLRNTTEPFSPLPDFCL